MKRSGTFLLLLVVGLLVYSLGRYLASIPQGARTVVKTALPLLLLLAVWACGRVERLRPWRSTALAYFAASCGFLLAWVLSSHLLDLFGITPDRLPGTDTPAAPAAGPQLCKLCDTWHPSGTRIGEPATPRPARASGSRRPSGR